MAGPPAGKVRLTRLDTSDAPASMVALLKVWWAWSWAGSRIKKLPLKVGSRIVTLGGGADGSCSNADSSPRCGFAGEP